MEIVCVRVCTLVLIVCVEVRLSSVCSWARWREHSLLSIWQLKTSHSKRPTQIVLLSPSPRKLRKGEGGGGVGGGGRGGQRRVSGGVHFLPNEAVRHTACWQKARIWLPPAYTPKTTSWSHFDYLKKGHGGNKIWSEYYNWSSLLMLH